MFHGRSNYIFYLQFSYITDDDFVVMMDMDGSDERQDLKVPDDEVGKEIRMKEEAGGDFIVTVLSAVGEERIVGTKVLTI